MDLLSNGLVVHCSLFGYRPTYETISPLWLAARFLFWKALLLVLRGTSSGYCCLLPFVGGRVSLCEKRIFIVRHQFVTYSAVVVGHPMLIPLVMMLVFLVSPRQSSFSLHLAVLLTSLGSLT